MTITVGRIMVGIGDIRVHQVRIRNVFDEANHVVTHITEEAGGAHRRDFGIDDIYTALRDEAAQRSRRFVF